jgi:DNA-binding transcriptional MerR regulator/anti-sigma regulatory factor (Ser/Thr protein kinase)
VTGLLEIGTVARELGVAPSTLRTWERRYRLVVPRRGRQGQRLYDPDQVVTLRRVLSQVRRGTRASLAHDLAAGPQPLRTVRARLLPTPEAPQDARRAVDGLLRDSDDRHFAFFLRLVASELVKNAVLYGSGRSPISLTAFLFSDSAEVQIANGGGRLSLRRMREGRREGGRGLDIVDELADAWSIDTGPTGTKVTVRLSAGLTTGRTRAVFRSGARMGRVTRPVR